MLGKSRQTRCRSPREVVGVDDGATLDATTVRLHLCRDILRFIREQLLHFTCTDHSFALRANKN